MGRLHRIFPDVVDLHAIAIPHHNIEADPIRPDASAADD